MDAHRSLPGSSPLAGSPARGLPSRRGFLAGAAAFAIAPLLRPVPMLGTAQRARRRPGPGPRRAGTPAAAAPAIGATVGPLAYGVGTWLEAAKIFDSYTASKLAVTTQKVYMTEGQFWTTLPGHITGLAKAGCRFIICAFPSRSTDDSARLASFLDLLNTSGIVYQLALVNEWNVGTKFTPATYLAYWRHYAPVVQAAGAPLALMVCASSSKTAYAKIEPGFPTTPLPGTFWMDYYATAYQYNVRLDSTGGLLDLAGKLGVPAGVGEFGIGAHGEAPWDIWLKYVPYLAGLAPRLPAGCLYWGSRNPKDTVTGSADVVTSSSDPKIPGIHQVISAF